MSFKTNRRTRGVFPVGADEPGAGARRRYVCHVCQAVLGQDMPSEQAEMEARITGREVAGTPLSSFVSKAELQEHMRRVHPTGERLPTKAHRQLGRVPQKERVPEEVESDEGSIVGTEGSLMEDEDSGDEDSLVGDMDDDSDILGTESEKEEIF